MSIEQIFTSLSTLNPDFFIKIFMLVLVGFYFIFTFVVYRQISLMSQTVKTILSPLLKFITVLLMISVGFLFLMTLVIV